MEQDSLLSSFAAAMAGLATPETIAPTAIDGVSLIHASKETLAIPTLYEPSLCLIAQGSKQVMLGTKVLRYEAGQCLVASLDLPVKGSVIGATSKEPYLCLMLTVKAALLYDLLPSVPLREQERPSTELGLSVHRAEPELLECAIKLCRLLERPADIAVLAPLVIREMHYRLLSGPQGVSLRQIATRGGNGQKIAKVVGYLKENFSKPLAIAELAKIALIVASKLSPSRRVASITLDE